MKKHRDALNVDPTNPSDVKRLVGNLSIEDKADLIFSELQALPPESLGRFVEAIGMVIQSQPKT